MSAIINTTQIHRTNFIQDRPGQFRTVIKVAAGFLTVCDHAPYWKRAIDVFRSYRGGALETIQFKADGTDIWLTVFAKSGKKVKIMDDQLFSDMKVGDINDGKYWSKTNLYDQAQYSKVGAKTWDSFVFIRNAA
jgi:hypothetical protein